MNLEYTGHLDTEGHFDFMLWERQRRGKWIFRVVWYRDWAVRPKGGYPFKRDPGGYCKWSRIGDEDGWYFAVGHFATLLYRVSDDFRLDRWLEIQRSTAAQRAASQGRHSGIASAGRSGRH